MLVFTDLEALNDGDQFLYGPVYLISHLTVLECLGESVRFKRISTPLTTHKLTYGLLTIYNITSK